MFEKLLNKDKTNLLSNKINEFYKWVKTNCSDEFSDNEIERLKNFVESMAVWYEFCYPIVYDDYEYVNELMFGENGYINKEFDKESEVRLLEWNKLFNCKSFISLTNSIYLDKPKYPSCITILLTIGNQKRNYGFEITSNGKLRQGGKSCFMVGDFRCNDISLKEFQEQVPYVISNFCNARINEIISEYEKGKVFKEKLLDTVMYRIIERGGSRSGSKRALRFAIEFKRDINIPMKYGIDSSNPYLREFINEYLHAGGSVDLLCYENYFRGDTSLVSLRDILKYEDYTEEEHDLHQRLVNALSTAIDQDELKEQQLRRERIK